MNEINGKRYLIAFDLDGTVLPELRELPRRTCDAVRAAAAAGHLPVITTARPWKMTRWVYEEMRLDTPVVLSNGARLWHPHDPSFPGWYTRVPADGVRLIFKTARDARVTVTDAVVEDGARFWTLNERKRGYLAERAVWTERLRFDPDNPPDTAVDRIMLYTATHEDNLRLLGALRGLAGYRTEPTEDISAKGVYRGRMTVIPEGTDKFRGVTRIAEYYGIPDGDIYAFGDEWNDFAMVSRAAHGYAMKASKAEPFGRHVTRFDCRGCGVADIIENEILSGDAKLQNSVDKRIK